MPPPAETPGTITSPRAASPAATAVAGVRLRIAAAARAAGREPDAVRLVGVTKTLDLSDTRRLHAAGVADLGENRPVEGASKAAAFGPGPTWHLIGPLQRNKARRAAEAFAVIHSVDGVRLLDALDRVAGEVRTRPAILLQVNVAAEAQKQGCTPDEAPALAEAAARCAHLRLAGLMTMTPVTPDPEASRPHFAALRLLRDRLVASGAAPAAALRDLSMGMSQDYGVAIAEGATLVRVGTALVAGWAGGGA